MKVLIACEFSGIVRDAFIAKGHDAISCDLLPSEKRGPHIQGDVRDVLGEAWDLMIAHPPCTHICSSGARWFKYKKEEQEKAISFVYLLMKAPIEKIAIENPIGILSTRIGTPTQIIHPWWFGCPESKSICLWLKGLPRLKPTLKLHGVPDRIHRLSQSQDRWKERSRSFVNVATAMANQWGTTS